MGSPELCEKYPELMEYINLCHYSVWDVSLVVSGTLFWVICYIAIIARARKVKFVEMPVFVAAANIAWEFVWSFIFKTDMGLVFLWGYRAWFFLDVWIFCLLWKYGYQQFVINWVRQYFKPILLFITSFFIFFFYAFAKGGFDTNIGATSAYLISVAISTLYITLFLSNKNAVFFSWTAAWSRVFGDLIMTVFVFKYYDIQLLYAMGVYVGLLDVIYLIMFAKRRKALANQPIPAPLPVILKDQQ